MCGLYGLVDRRGNLVDGLALQKKRLEMLFHRGPDDCGWTVWKKNHGFLTHPTGNNVQGNLFLGHRRLSILDLSIAGRQPMVSPNGRYHLIFNGEIYNYRELREVLAGKGHIFRTQTDTEVLLAAHAQWQESALERLTGMFAYAVFDSKKQELFLARDPFGIKPIFFSRWSQGFAFSSEIGPLLDLPTVTTNLNPQKLYDYLQFGLTDNDDATLIEDIHQLPAAHYLRYDLKSWNVAETRRYWKINPDNRLEISFGDAAKQMRELFLESVELHLRSDVTVGAALSGGIDSSAIVCAIRRLKPDSDLHTFTYIADEADLSEEKWADTVGKAVGATMHKVSPSAEDLINDLDSLIHSQGEPFGSTSIYAQYRVFGLAKDVGIKVMLDGQGADEMLAGYSGYAGARLADLVWQLQLPAAWRFLQRSANWPGRSQKMILKRALNYFIPRHFQPLARKLVGKELVSEWMNKPWFKSTGVRMFLPAWNNNSRNCLREELARSLESISVPSLLRYEDRNSMAHSIESRVPFLTTKIANFVFSLPEEYIIDANGQSKAVFRAAMRGIVPDSILDRRDKLGFATPEKKWLSLLTPWVENSIQKINALDMLNADELQKEWHEIQSGSRNFGWHIWWSLNFVRWLELSIEEA